LPPGVVAFGTAEETDLTLVSRPQLPEPPDGEIVLALGTPDLDGRHGFYALSIFLNNRNLVFPALNFLLHLVSALNLAGIPALPALELTS